MCKAWNQAQAAACVPRMACMWTACGRSARLHLRLRLQRVSVGRGAQDAGAGRGMGAAAGGASTGVYVGCVWQEYARLLETARVPPTVAVLTGSGMNFMVGRVSYTFGLQGVLLLPPPLTESSCVGLAHPSLPWPICHLFLTCHARGRQSTFPPFGGTFSVFCATASPREGGQGRRSEGEAWLTTPAEQARKLSCACLLLPAQAPASAWTRRAPHRWWPCTWPDCHPKPRPGSSAP